MANKETKRLGNKGFSLVELIVVIAIMAVLVGVLAPQFIRYVEKSRQSGDITSIQQIMTAIETSASEDGKITGEVTISINGSSVSVTGTGTEVTNALAESGLNSTVTLKSTGWPAVDIKYDVTTFKWSTTATNTKNSKEPQVDLKTLLNTSATPAT